MKFYQTRKYDMVWYTAGLLKRNKETLAKRVPALGDLIDDFAAQQKALEKLLLPGKNLIAVKTLTKQSTRDGLVDSILELSAMLRASHYKNAVKKKNGSAQTKSLADTYYYTRSDLIRAKAELLIKIGKQVIAASKKTKFASRYGISTGDIKAADTYYKEFSGVKNTPLKKKKEVSRQNKDLNTKLNALVAMLENSIDPLMHIATKDDQEMRMAYNGTRKVLYRGPGAITDQEARYRKSREKKGKAKEDGRTD